MKIEINIELHAIKKTIMNFKKKVSDNKKNIAFGLIAIYIFASIFYIGIDVAMGITNNYVFEGVCTNISDHNFTINNMTLYFFRSFSNYTKNMLEGNRTKIDCWYSRNTESWHWASIENLDYEKP